MSTLTLEPAEIERLTGHTQPRRQVKALRADGFWRARLVKGQAVLERAHYEAVCSGAVAPGAKRTDTNRPQVRAPA